MRTVLGLFSLVLSLSCIGALGLWVYQVITLSALVAMQGGVATSWSISPLGWLLLTLMAGGAIEFLGLGLALLKSREPDYRRLTAPQEAAFMACPDSASVGCLAR